MKDPSRQIARYLDGNLDDTEINKLLAWLAESPQNAEIFAKQSLLDQHLTELLDGGLVKPLETSLEQSATPEMVQNNVRSWQRFKSLIWTGALAAACLIIISSWMAIDSRRQVADLKTELKLAQKDVARAEQDVVMAQQETVLVRQELAVAQQEAAITPTDDSATINLYLKEHRDVVAQPASFSTNASQPTQMRVSQDDILYYEFFDDGPDYMPPGIIVRGPSSQSKTGSSETPVISNGHTLTLSEARQAAGFNLVSPSWLRPGYTLDQIRRIEGRDALHLLYTDGVNSVSFFEQPLNGQRGLEPKDFREYAVYHNTKPMEGTILAWRDDELSYVLIGNTDMSQLMDMAKSISAAK